MPIYKTPWPGLGAISALAVLVHGYHLGVDDSAIYLPAVKRVADPALYPFGAEFFLTQTRLSIFPQLVGYSARLAHLPVNGAIFAWHALSILLLLLAAWQVLGCCFESAAAHWGGVAFLAATLSVPVAGTALVIMDPYLTARSLSTPAMLFGVACCLANRPWRALAWVTAAAALHPLMAVYGALFIACLILWRIDAHKRPAPAPTMPAPAPGTLLVLPGIFSFEPVTGPARDCLLARQYLFVTNWAWFEWLGAAAPLLLSLIHI